MFFSTQYAPSTKNTIEYAEDAVRNMRNVYNFDLSYTVASLQLLDFVLMEWREQGAQLDQITKSLFAMGCYAGEVLLSKKPGKWIELGDDAQHGSMDEFPFIAVQCNDGRLWRPINLSFMVFDGGGGHSFYTSCMEITG